MTKEEYLAEKVKVLAGYADPPKWRGKQPMNPPAKAIASLKARYTVSLRRDRPVRTPEAIAAREAAEAVNAPRGDMRYGGMVVVSPEIDIKDNDLNPFDNDEKKIIREYFKNVRQTYKQVGNSVGLPYEKVTCTLQSDAFKQLYSKYFDRIMDLEAFDSLRHSMRKGDSKAAVDWLRNKGLMKSETIDHSVVHKIEDPRAFAMLNSTGDTLATESPSAYTPTGTPPAPSTPKSDGSTSINTAR